MRKKVIVWFRDDLRLTDHAALNWAVKQGANVLPVYCIDKRFFCGKTYQFRFPRAQGHRVRFWLDSLADLRKRLQSANSDLYLLEGAPEVWLAKLAQTWGAEVVTFFTNPATEEASIEAGVIATLKPLGIETKIFWGNTLYHPDELPFHIQHLPDQFTEFRKNVENRIPIRQPLAAPTYIFTETDLPPGNLPTLAELGFTENVMTDSRSVLDFRGGERQAKQRMQYYIWDKTLLKTYKITRNGLLGSDYSSKFSPWLAFGCISPAMIYEEVERFEHQVVKNDSTYWLVFELLWRDYFKFLLARYGKKLFSVGGIQGLPISWTNNTQHFEAWIKGLTGYPLIDANMRELYATGFMSNRGRQNVASFLTKNLGLDWRMGAEWFESCLIDYDPASNYGNWNYAASIGTDPRGYRFFHPTKQAKDYDPQGEYIRTWLPELAKVPAPKIFEPWRLSPQEQKRYQADVGQTYPLPIVPLEESFKQNESLYKKALQDADIFKIKSRIRLYVNKR